MTKTSETSRNALINILRSSGVWAKDRWGNYIYTGSNITGNYRFIFNTTSVRFEKKDTFKWMNIVTDYYENISCVDGKVSFGKKTINAKYF